MIDTLEATSLKKIVSPFSNNYQMPIAPQLGAVDHEAVCKHSGMLTGLILDVSCTGDPSFCELMSAVVLSCPEHNVLSYSSLTSVPTIFLPSLP